MREKAMGKLRRGLVVISIVASLLSATNAVQANGAPIKIVLSYVSDLSNWGPTVATGTAEVIMKEGEVKLDVVGLPTLAGETYHAWLINSKSKEVSKIGVFNTDAKQTAKADMVLPGEIPDKGWDVFLITVEAEETQASAPGARHSLAGRFPEPAQAKSGPEQLPKTGGETDSIQRSVAPLPTAWLASQPQDKTNQIDIRYAGYAAILLAAALSVQLLRRRRRRAARDQ